MHRNTTQARARQSFGLSLRITSRPPCLTRQDSNSQRYYITEVEVDSNLLTGNHRASGDSSSNRLGKLITWYIYLQCFATHVCWFAHSNALDIPWWVTHRGTATLRFEWLTWSWIMRSTGKIYLELVRWDKSAFVIYYESGGKTPSLNPWYHS